MATDSTKSLYNTVVRNVPDTSALPALLGTTNEIYITLRTDGKTGSGTKLDPFDGSTSVKLDTALRGISANTAVLFGPGTFQTSGFQNNSSSLGFSVKLGCKYIGTGRDVTIIKLITAIGGNGSGTAGYAISGDLTDVSGSTVRDLTVDCNGAALVALNSTTFSTRAVALNGSNCTIHNVRAFHSYGNEASGQEAFMIGIASPKLAGVDQPATGALIENCVVDTPAAGSDYGQMICISGGTSTLSGDIKGCTVKDQTTGTSAYQCYGTNARMIDNVAINCFKFLYMDAGNLDHVSVTNCHGYGITNTFIHLAPNSGSNHTNITIKNNTCDFSGSGQKGFVTLAGISSNHIVNVTMSGNTATTQSAVTRLSPIGLSYVDNFNPYNNQWIGSKVWQSPISNSLSNVTNARFTNNENLNSSLAGSIRITGNFTSGGRLLYQYSPSAYTIVSGDLLKYEIYCDEANASFRPSSFILFGDSTTNFHDIDQNGIPIFDDEGSDYYSELGFFARGKWYSPQFDLTAYAGKSTTSFKFGWFGNDTAQTGVNTVYVRNVRIVGANGVLKRTFYTEGTGAPSLDTNSNVSAYSAIVMSSGGGSTVATTTSVLKGDNAGNAVAATSGTDFAPATSGSAILYGNAAGGFSNVTIGAGVAFSGGTLSAGGGTSATIQSTSAVLKGDGAGNAIAATQTGSGNAVLATSPTLTTPTIGVATATSVNKWVLTAPSTAATLTSGADNLTYTMPEITTKIGFRHIPQVSFSTNTTTILTHAGKNLVHPASDANNRTLTIDSNANVVYVVGDGFFVTNLSANSVTVHNAAGTMTMLGAGSTGDRTIAQYGKAFFENYGADVWVVTPIANTT